MNSAIRDDTRTRYHETLAYLGDDLFQFRDRLAQGDFSGAAEMSDLIRRKRIPNLKRVAGRIRTEGNDTGIKNATKNEVFMVQGVVGFLEVALEELDTFLEKKYPGTAQQRVRALLHLVAVANTIRF